MTILEAHEALHLLVEVLREVADAVPIRTREVDIDWVSSDTRYFGTAL